MGSYSREICIQEDKPHSPLLKRNQVEITCSSTLKDTGLTLELSNGRIYPPKNKALIECSTSIILLGSWL